MTKYLFTKGYTPWNKGKKLAPLSEDLKRKISESNKGKKRSHQTIERLIISKTGIKYPNRKKPSYSWAKIRHKICIHCGKDFIPPVKNFLKTKFCSKSCSSKSHPSGRTGKINSQYQKDMVRLKMSGENHPRWIKERTERLDKNRIRNSYEINNWRKDIFRRDDYTCQECKIRGGYLEAHHIIPFRKDKNKIFDINNGITLCRHCHIKTMMKEKLFEHKYQSIIEHNISLLS